MLYYIGIDLGTSSVKLTLTDEEGNVYAQSMKEYVPLQPYNGWREIPVEDWWAATAEGLKELVATADRKRIRGIGITGQMHTLVLLGEDGKVLRPAILWNDIRTKELLPELMEKLRGTQADHIRQFISTGSPAANLMWVRLNEPETFSRIRKFLIGPDYLVYRFTGVCGTDYCEASTSSLYDLYNRTWSEVMLELIGLDERVCPKVRGSAQAAGNILPEMAEYFDLPQDVKVIVGTGDNPAAALPTGALGGGYPVMSLGTSGVLVFSREEPRFDVKGKNILFSFDGNLCHTLTQGVIQSCGLGYSWLIRKILHRDDFGIADHCIDIETLGEYNLLFYPHINGDKTIYQDPDLRGAYIGLGSDTSDVDMIRAYMEGIAFALRQLMEEMNVIIPQEGLRFIGGGTKSEVWMQIMSDVLGIKVLQMDGNVGAGYGMAMLSAYSCGQLESVEMISEKAVSIKKEFMPRVRNCGLYEDGYRRYLKIHDCMKDILI